MKPPTYLPRPIPVLRFHALPVKTRHASGRRRAVWLALGFITLTVGAWLWIAQK